MTSPHLVVLAGIASFTVLGGFAGYAYYGVTWRGGAAVGLAIGIVYAAWFLRRDVD